MLQNSNHSGDYKLAAAIRIIGTGWNYGDKIIQPKIEMNWN